GSGNRERQCERDRGDQRGDHVDRDGRSEPGLMPAKKSLAIAHDEPAERERRDDDPAERAASCRVGRNASPTMTTAHAAAQGSWWRELVVADMVGSSVVC